MDKTKLDYPQSGPQSTHGLQTNNIHVSIGLGQEDDVDLNLFKHASLSSLPYKFPTLLDYPHNTNHFNFG